MANLKDVLNKIKKDVQKSLEINVADMVKDKIVDHVSSDVYMQYTPSMYERKGFNDGLMDERNMDVLKYGECGIEIQNNTMDDGKNITEVVATGEGYDFNKTNGYPDPPYSYQQPRNFMKNAKEEIKEKDLHTKELKKSLLNKGYKMD